METGSNKSLFTLIAVVIFGVFLSLSYWLFQDELVNVLASVMDNTIETTSIKLDNNGSFPTNEFYFTVVSNGLGTCKITGYNIDGGSEIIIPEEINNLKVTEIGANAFRGCDLKSVVFAKTIESIGDYSFGFNYNLTTVTLNDGLTTIQGHAFNSTGIKSLTVPKSVTFIGHAFISFNPSLKELVLPDQFSFFSEPTNDPDEPYLRFLLNTFSWDGSTNSVYNGTYHVEPIVSYY